MVETTDNQSLQLKYMRTSKLRPVVGMEDKLRPVVGMEDLISFVRTLAPNNSLHQKEVFDIYLQLFIISLAPKIIIYGTRVAYIIP